ncbi:uncharacterized protein [Coffea arabica]|uniref:Uncharacterized protein n=1 Tax=Coffea arabica TaxID=13443 RepID=A0ABM4VGZ0_COFAR
MAALNRFLSRSAVRGLPFFRILKAPKDFQWTEKCHKAFADLKAYLAELPTLTVPEQGETLFLYLSACNETVSAVLVRVDREAQKPIYYVSRALQGSEARYTPAEKLVLALVHAARKLRPYFQAHSIVVMIDQPLRQILTKPEVSSRMTKWAVELAEHDIGYQPRTAIKTQALADFLAEGARLRITHQMGITAIKVWSDSQLVVHQIRGEYEAKEDVMKKYLVKAREAITLFDAFEIEWVPRSQNKRTDALSKLASSSFAHLSKEVLVEVVKQKSIDQIRILAIASPASWMTPLMDFLGSGVLPGDRTETRRLQLRTAKYAYAGGTLYRRSYLPPWLKCVTPEKSDYILREVHEGLCAAHVGSWVLAKKCLLLGYYWPTVFQDAAALVQKCRACQVHALLRHQPTREMVPIHNP